MVVPVDNRSYMKKATDRAKTRKLNKKKKNIGAASSFTKKGTPLGRSRTSTNQSDDTGPAKKIGSAPKALSRSLKKKPVNPKMADSAKRIKANPELYEKPERIKQSTSLKAKPFIEDEGGQGRASSNFKTQGMIRKARNSTKASAPKPVKGPKAAQSISSTGGVGLKGKSKAKPFIEDEGGQGRVSSDFKTQGMISKARNSTKASAPKPVGRRASPHPVSPKPKPAAPAPAASAAPKKAPKKAPRPRSKPSRLTGGGMDAELLATPAGVTSGRVKKTARSSETSGEGFDPGEFKTTAVIKSDPTEGGMYAFTPKDSKSIMGMTQKGYDEMMEDSSGEKRGGRPGRGKLKTQGMNKKGKRKAGFSGKGAGAALRGF